uniref:PreS1 protein n=1 Tax=Hepatitis B virus TaxID=10407 RepID=O09514_HBV|nr:preS1 [Hepatitis B virus]
MGTNLSVPNPWDSSPIISWTLHSKPTRWGRALRLRAYSQLCQQLLLLPPPIGSQEGSLLPYLHL